MAANERYRYTYDKENKLACELYDLEKDCDEMHNLVDDPAFAGHPERHAQRLRAVLHEFMTLKTIMSAALTGCLLLGAVEKKKDESLAPIPKEAELVCQSATGGEKSSFGVPATEIYVADSKGDHLTRITHQKKLYNHIAVSSDRNWIVAGRFDRGDTSGDGIVNAKDRKTLVVLDLEHKQEWSIVPEADDLGLGGVDWTPDGKYIITSMKFKDRTDIYRVHPDGTGLENLTKNLGKLLGLASRPIWVSDVSVSFDGKWIVFLCVTKRSALCQLARMRIDGSEAAHLSPTAAAKPRAIRAARGERATSIRSSAPMASTSRFSVRPRPAIGPAGYPSSI